MKYHHVRHPLLSDVTLTWVQCLQLPYDTYSRSMRYSCLHLFWATERLNYQWQSWAWVKVTLATWYVFLYVWTHLFLFIFFFNEYGDSGMWIVPPHSSPRLDHMLMVVDEANCLVTWWWLRLQRPVSIFLPWLSSWTKRYSFTLSWTGTMFFPVCQANCRDI